MVPRFQVFTDRKGRGVFPDGRNDIWTCCVWDCCKKEMWRCWVSSWNRAWSSEKWTVKMRTNCSMYPQKDFPQEWWKEHRKRCSAWFLELRTFSVNASYSIIYLSLASVPCVLVSLSKITFIYVVNLCQISIYNFLMWFNLYSRHRL
jgi:hypothetical protein